MELHLRPAAYKAAALLSELRGRLELPGIAGKRRELPALLVVWAAGFDPATSPFQAGNATGLRYTQV